MNEQRTPITSDLQRDVAAAPSRGLMAPYVMLGDFLDGNTVADLLAFTLASEPQFEAAMVGRRADRAINPTTRVSVATRNLGDFVPALRSKLLALVPELVAKLGISSLQAPQIELQLVAHNDGAFFKRHIDTFTVAERGSLRLLSAIYYFHAEPKGFSGGALRLYAIGGNEDEDFVDVDPVHNSLLVFPSWAPHEVMPISCPSKRFIDSRFAINCWVRRQSNAAS
jgi:Rps23 Pro-64 3,4-dihydroxylase Tpa1-like proline 4-hydroxylase